MLAEVAAGSLEPTHISSPLRTSLRRTEVVRGHVARSIWSGAGCFWKQMVAVPRTTRSYSTISCWLWVRVELPGMEGLGQEAFDFKSLADAIRIRNHVIDVFERADREPDPEIARRC